MGGVIYFRAFRTRGVYANMSAFRRVVGEGMTATVFPKIQKRLQAKVAHWKIEVKFLMTKIINEKGITVKAFPSGTGAKYWKWATRGTKGHTIRVKKKHTQKFHKFKRYKPALGIPPKGARMNPALRAAGIAFRYQLFVPARPGKFYEKQVALEYNLEFRRDMENIVKRGVRAAQREGT